MLANPLYSIADKIYSSLSKKTYLEKSIYIITLSVFIILGIYLRALPAINYGLELHANDPWIEYWQANYTYHHGLLSWYSLTRENPDTHSFWYPWGRDFVLSSYPGLPIWTAATYYIVRYTGLSLKDWVVLQPLIFAFFSYITLILVVKEVSRGNKYAVIASTVLYTVVPAASDRNIVGFVEKEGIAITFIFLTVYLYSKLARMINNNKVSENKKILYTILTALSIAAIGWFWGGYVYILGTMVAFIVLYPLFNPRNITMEFLKYHILLIILSMIFVVPAPSNLRSLGFIPFRLKAPGMVMLASLILPVIYALLSNYYRRIGLKKKIMNPVRYFALIVLILIVGVSLYAIGYINISPRFAWALGLRAIAPAPPLVQSIEEHQSPLSSPGMVSEMLISWGTGVIPLLLFSPLVLAILGSLYLLYKGGMDQIYLAIAFLIGFYTYMNAAYMEATASSTGLVVAGVFLGYIASKIIPTREEIMEWRKGRIRAGSSTATRIVASLITVLVAVNLVFSGINIYRTHNTMIYSIMAGGAPIAARTDAWYEAIDFLRNNLTENSVVIAWWDYGYWISVAGHKKTVADGATLNSTQIAILAKILTSTSEEELVKYMRMLKLPPNDTYVLVFDVFWFFRDTNNPNQYTVMPYYSPFSLVGMVDIPKSIWMIRIGGRDISQYFYLYTLGDKTGYIAPRFDQPEKLPLIYKIMVDGILSLNMFEENRTFKFAWYRGTESTLSYKYETLRKTLGITKEVVVTRSFTGQYNMMVLEPKDRPLANNTYIKPYMIIAKPFIGITTPEGATLVEVIFIYKITYSQQ